MSAKWPGLVADASVLIDYQKSDPGILRRAAIHLAPICVPLPVFEKIKGWSREELKKCRLELVSCSLEQLEEAIRLREGPPPSPVAVDDWTCLVVARDRGWACLSNDKNLRRQCASRGVPAVWGLELLVELAHAGRITVAQARVVGLAIRDNSSDYYSPRIMAILERRLEEITRGREKGGSMHK